MKIGILGLPGCGKSTVFDILVGDEQSFQRDGTGARLGSTKVPDPRVDALRDLYQPKKTTYSQVDLVDFAALRKGARPGETFSSRLLGLLRTVDALLIVVRAFDSEALAAPADGVDPLRDACNVAEELLLADLSVVEAKTEKLAASVERGLKEDRKELERMKVLAEFLENGRPLRSMGMSPEELEGVKGFSFLTLKPTLIVANLDEEGFRGADAVVTSLEKAVPDASVLPLSAAIEKEIGQLDEEDRQAFMEELGLEIPARDRLLQGCYRLLGLLSFFTVGEDEVRAWTLRDGGTTVDAAGKIHTDLAKRFIRAEVFHWKDLIEAGSEAALKSLGKWRLEGKTHVVLDGEVVHIRAGT